MAAPADKSELETFEDSILGKAANTKKTYLRAYHKLRDALDKDIHTASQKNIIEHVKELAPEMINSQAQLINVAILIRRLYQYDVKELIAKRDDNKVTIQECVKQNNSLMELPPLQEFDDHIESLYAASKWREFIINYLLRNCYVRNNDLLFEIVRRKKDTKDEDTNHMWLQAKKVTYYRKVYKTATTYGMKTNIITDPRFIIALKQINQPLIPTPQQVGYYVKQMSFQQLGEGAIVKIIVNHHRADIDKLLEISKSRGTDIKTLITTYNIQYK